MSQPTQRLLEGLKLMHKGALLLVIGSLVFGAGLASLFLSLIPLALTKVTVSWEARVGGEHGWTPMTPAVGPSVPWISAKQGAPLLAGALLAVFVLSVTAILAGAIVSLIGLYAYFVPGTRRLADAEPRYSLPSTLVRIGYVWGLVLAIVGAVLLVIVIGIFVLIPGLILLLIGEIGLIILAFYLYDYEKNSLYLAAAILFIVGLFIPILPFIGWILMYAALGDTIRKYSSIQAQPGPPALPPV